MKKTEVVTVLKNRIKLHTERGVAYTLPASYNSIWRKKLEELVAKKIIRKDKAGYSLMKKK